MPDPGPIHSDDHAAERLAAMRVRDDKVYVGAQLRAARERRRLALTDLPGLSDGVFLASAVGSYERGERSVPSHKLVALARIYKVRVSDLLPPATDLAHVVDVLDEARRLIVSVEEDLTRLVGVPQNAHALAHHAARYLSRSILLLEAPTAAADAAAGIDVETAAARMGADQVA